MIWRLAGKPSASGSVSFSDVSSSRSTYSAMKWAVGQNIIKGYSDGSFRPTDTVTRQQVAIMLWRMAGKPSSGSRTSFTDITSSASGYDAIQWGAAAGLIKGFSDGSFSPDTDCLRQQIVIFLYRYAKNVMGRDASSSQIETVSSYSSDQLKKKLQEVTSEEIVSFVYDDYDNDGIYEAYGITKNSKTGKAWFISGKSGDVFLTVETVSPFVGL